MNIEEISVYAMTAFLSNPKSIEMFYDPEHPETVMTNVAKASIMYAKALKDELKNDLFDVEDAMIVE